ncbi:MAG: caspase family protein [Bacteroidales bacterium]
MKLPFFAYNDKSLLRHFFVLWFFLGTIPFLRAQLGEPILRLNSDMHTAFINRISTDSSGKYLLTVSDDKTAKLWDTRDGSLIRTYRVPVGEGNEGMLYAGAISPDGQMVAVGGFTGKLGSRNFSIYLFHTQTGELFKRLDGLGNVIHDLEFSPDGKHLSAGLGGTQGVRVYNTRTWGFTELKGYEDNVYNTAFSFDNKLLATVSDDGYIRLYDSLFRLIKKQKTEGGSSPFSLAFSPDGTKIAVGYDDSPTIEVLDAKDLQVLYRADISNTDKYEKLDKVLFSKDGKYLFAGGSYSVKQNGEWKYVIRRWDNAGKGAYVDYPVADDNIMDLKTLPDGKIAFCSANPDMGILNTAGQTDWINIAEIYSFGAKDRSHLKINDTGSEIGFKPFGNNAMTFDLQTRKLLEKSSSLPSYTDNYSGISVTDWKDSYSPGINGKTINFLKQYERNRSVDIGTKGQRIVFGANWTIYCLDKEGNKLWKTPTQATTWAVNISGNDKVVIAAMGDGTLRWYRMTDGQLLLTLYINPETKNWVLWTPSGYYDASAGGENLIGWHLNNGLSKEAYFYPVSKFRNTYYRPDVIDRILETYDESEALRLADEERNRISAKTGIKNTLPPIVQILSPETGTALKDNRVTLVYKAVSPGGEPVNQVQVQVDGRTVQHIQSPSFNSRGEAEVKLNLEESSKVSILAQNRHGFSEPSTIKLIVPAAKGSKPISSPKEVPDHLKPSLYALVIGVDKYSDPNLTQLNLAVKDARDFANILKKQKGLLYKDVEVRLLTDESATKDNILDGLEWLEREVNQRDIGIIFLSGHGVDDNVGNFYYIPIGGDLNSLKRTGVNKSDIMSTVQNLAGKAVVFMDACHSGQVGTQTRKGLPDMNGLINEFIEAQNGAFVFTSSTGREYSLEDSNWGNGAFTKALVEGLSGAAAGSDGVITPLSLSAYLARRVKEITGGKQHPTFDQPSNQSDFPFALKP